MDEEEGMIDTVFVFFCLLRIRLGLSIISKSDMERAGSFYEWLIHVNMLLPNFVVGLLLFVVLTSL